jgi:REP element-mobilizing transposase RayT
MALPRSKYVQEGQEGVYHCFSRCVRRAFLCGFDRLTGRDFSHRKAWLVERLRYLAAVFAIEVCAYSVMENHYHVILRTRPDIVALWSDREVATRWLTLFPRHRDIGGTPTQPAESEIRALADCPERIAQLRQRLSNLSWFMGRLNEFIARAANKEDRVKGRFWESRFKCQALLDDAAIAACMVYVDLNPIRAGKATTPEESDFTSIQERIRAWQKETMTAAAASPETTAQGLQPASVSEIMTMPSSAAQFEDNLPVISNSPNGIADPTRWLCPIRSDSERRGILPMSAAEYFDLVDKSGRMIRMAKRGNIDPDLVPILLQIGANPDAWPETVTRFGSNFRLAAGLLGNLRKFANQIGRRWLMGAAAARAAFLSSSPQLA